MLLLFSICCITMNDQHNVCFVCCKHIVKTHNVTTIMLVISPLIFHIEFTSGRLLGGTNT